MDWQICPVCDDPYSADELSDHLWKDHLAAVRSQRDLRRCWCGERLFRNEVADHMDTHGGIKDHFVACTIECQPA